MSIVWEVHGVTASIKPQTPQKGRSAMSNTEKDGFWAWLGGLLIVSAVVGALSFTVTTAVTVPLFFMIALAISLCTNVVAVRGARKQRRVIHSLETRLSKVPLSERYIRAGQKRGIRAEMASRREMRADSLQHSRSAQRDPNQVILDRQAEVALQRVDQLAQQRAAFPHDDQVLHDLAKAKADYQRLILDRQLLSVESLTPVIRIGHKEREMTFTELGDHYAEGRIDAEEFEARSTAAGAAKTAAELIALVADLPEVSN